MKSDRLKKLENELKDLEQWMKLGLVPKKELERHQDEITSLQARIQEEKDRLNFLKESGDVEEYTTPRRSPAKTVYPDTPSMSDVELGETTEAGLEMETESMETDTTVEEKEESSDDDYDRTEEEDPFSDRNRWKRGGIIDPDANEW